MATISGTDHSTEVPPNLNWQEEAHGLAGSVPANAAVSLIFQPRLGHEDRETLADFCGVFGLLMRASVICTRDLARFEPATDNLLVQEIEQSTNTALALGASWLQSGVPLTFAFEQNRTVFAFPGPATLNEPAFIAELFWRPKTFPS